MDYNRILCLSKKVNLAMSVIRSLGRFVRDQLKAFQTRLATAYQKVAADFREADISIFHEFWPPPEGGGHQFMRALWDEFQRMGFRLENNTISRTTHVCLFNSFNFNFDRLRRLRRHGCRMVHRVDGPIGVYRGWDDGTDRNIWQINHEIADATIFQSHFSMQKHLELGLRLKEPCVIMNAADPDIFYTTGRVAFDRKRKIRLISTSWSDNPNKGAATYKWLEDHLDWKRFEYTFVGRSKITFKQIQMIQPVPSGKLADLLRQHDIYIIASRNDPCSNALIEALSCGLPALYLNSGGHPEIVREGGLSFSKEEEITELLDRLIDEYEYRQSRIALPSLSQVADQYLSIMGVGKADDREI